MMRFNKKGTELSMNVIIIAAIAILVLVILAVFVFRTGNQVDKGTGCESLGGKCMPAPCGSTNPTYKIHNVALDGTCSVDVYQCCMSLGSSN